MTSEILEQARARVAAIPIEQIDLSDPSLFRNDTIGLYFDRLRREAPVHYRKDGMYGSFWSITKFNDIVEVEKNHAVFSSDAKHGGIRIDAQGLRRQNFMNMDPPRHGAQRNAVTPVFATPNLAAMQAVVREKVTEILDSLPIGETFDWVERVSREQTSHILATLFGIPTKDRYLLLDWSDIATVDLNAGTAITTHDERERHLQPCYDYFAKVWEQRLKNPGPDLVSMLAHSEAAQSMTADEIRGSYVLLIIAGNDTTRSSISGGLFALTQNPGEYQKLRERPELIPNMVSEIVRWQTPLSHMARGAVEDVVVGGQQIRKGDRVVVWYLSGNRDEEVIEDGHQFRIDRQFARHHTSFGFGVHRCVGNRLAEMQLQILWEEIMKRFDNIELVGEPVRTFSNFVHGFDSMPVRIRTRK